MLTGKATRAAALAAVLFWTFAAPLGAADWITSGGGVWSAGGNWDTGTPPNGVDAVARFIGDTPYASNWTVTGASGTLGSLWLEDTAPQSPGNYNGWVIQGGPLTIDVSSGQGLISARDSIHLLQTPLVLNDNVDIVYTRVGDDQRFNLTSGISSGTGLTTNIDINRYNPYGSGSFGRVCFDGNNTFTGDVHVWNAVFQLGSSGALPGTASVTIESGASMRLLYNYTNTINALNGSGNITMYGSAAGQNATLVVGSAGGSGSFSGSIYEEGTTYNLSLRKTGAGTQTLSGASTYRGGTTISQGTLVVANSSALGTGPIVLGDAATGTSAVALRSSVNFARDITVSNNGTGTVTIAGDTNYITYSGTLNLNRPTILGGTASDRYAYSGKITGNVGTLTIDAPRITFEQSAANASDFTGSVIINPGRILQFNSIYGLSGQHAVTANGSLYLNVGNGNQVSIGSLSGTGYAGLHPSVSGTQTLSVGGDNGNGSFSGTLSNGGGVLAVVKTGSGTQTLSGASTYTGTTTVSAGTLQIGNNTTTGSISASSPVSVAGGATVQWYRSDTSQVTVGNAISGAGVASFRGAGAADLASQYALTGNNSGFTGTWALDGGRLSVSAANHLGSGTVDVRANGQLLLNGAFTAANNVTVTDSSGWRDSGIRLGAIRLEGNANLSGNITLNQTTGVVLGDNSGLGAVVSAYSQGNHVLSGAISGTGEFSMSRYTSWNDGSTQHVNVFLQGSTPNSYTGKTVVDGQGGKASLWLAKGTGFMGGFAQIAGSPVAIPDGATITGLTGYMGGGFIGNTGTHAAIQGDTFGGVFTDGAVGWVAFWDGGYTKAVQLRLNISGTAMTVTPLQAKYSPQGENWMSSLGNFDTGGNVTSIATTDTASGYGVFSLKFTGALSSAYAIPANTVVQMGSATGGQANLRMGLDDQFGPGVVMNFVNASGQWMRFDLEGTSQTLAGLNAGTLTTQAGAVIQNQDLQATVPTGDGTLTLNGNGTYLYNGYLRDQDNGGTTRKLNLVKSGAGAQTLVGSAINYTGTTAVNGGTLELYNTSGYRSATTVGGGATLRLSNTANQSLGAGATFTLDSGATLTHNGLTDGSDYLVLAGAVTVSGTTTINQHSVANTTGTNKNLFLDGGLKGSGTVTIHAAHPGNAVVLRNNNTDFSGTLIVNGIASATANAGSGIGVGGCTTGLQNADITLNGTMELLNQGIGWAGSAPGDFWMGALNGSGVMVANYTSGGQTRVWIGNTGNSGAFSGVIADGTGNQLVLTKIGAGTQTLSGPNTYTGGTTISAGTLVAGHSSALGSGAVTMNGGTLNTSVNLSNPITLNNTSNTIAPNGNYRLLSGQISGAGGFTVASGGGTPGLELNNPSNNFQGNVTINAGTYLRLTASEVLPNGVSLVNNGNLRLDVPGGGTETIAGLSGSGSVWVPTSNNAMHRLVVGFNGASSTYEGTIGAGGQNNAYLALTKTGTGTLTLAGASPYAGGTVIDAGRITAGNAGAFGTGGITVNAGGTAHFAGYNIANPVTLNGGALYVANGASGTITLSNVAGNAIRASGNYRVISGRITGPGGVTIDGGDSTAGVAFSNPANDFQGNVLINNTFGDVGRLRLDASEVIPDAAIVTINGGNLRGHNAGGVKTETIAGLNGDAGAVIFAPNSDPMNLRIGYNDTSSTFAGVIGASWDANWRGISIVKIGAGTLTLSGNSTYIGGTTVTAGRLLVNNTAGSGTGSGDVLVSGGLLGGNGTIGGSVMVNAPGSISAGNSPGHLSIGGAYTQTGTMLAEIGGYNQGATTADGYDWISVGGEATLDGTLLVDLLGAFQPQAGDTFHILTASGGITDNRMDVTWDPAELPPAQYWDYRIVAWTGAGGGEALELFLGVPEPASLPLLLVAGGAALAAAAARRRLRRGSGRRATSPVK